MSSSWLAITPNIEHLVTEADMPVDNLPSDASCDFDVMSSTLPMDQGPQPRDQIRLNPCEINTSDRYLEVTNAVTGAQSLSGLLIEITSCQWQPTTQ